MRKRSSIISPLLSRHALKDQTVRLNVLPTVFLAWWRDNVIIPRGGFISREKNDGGGGGEVGERDAEAGPGSSFSMCHGTIY